MMCGPMPVHCDLRTWFYISEHRRPSLMLHALESFHLPLPANHYFFESVRALKKAHFFFCLLNEIASNSFFAQVLFL